MNLLARQDWTMKFKLAKCLDLVRHNLKILIHHVGFISFFLLLLFNNSKGIPGFSTY